MIESINLNLIPSGVSPVCHVSQYDAGRQIKINLFEGINPYTIQSGDAFTLNVRKPDNTIVTTSVSGTQGNNYITIATTEQIAAVVGENLCELKITNGSTVIGTLNFIMIIERDVLADGIPSQSVIEDLDERIAEAIGDNYYNKTETDDLLNDKADKSNTYTKTETDSLLALKADKSEIYNVYPTEQESGAIAHFTDGADNIPVKSLVSEIVAVESGSGEKSPDNPYSISGFDSGVVSVCGKNLLSLNNVDFTLKSVRYYTSEGNLYLNGTSTGETSSKDTAFKNNLNFILKAGTYYFNRGNTGLATYLYDYYDDTKPAIVTNSGSFTLTEDTRVYIGFYVYNKTFDNLKSEIMVNIGSTATTYEAYNGNTYEFAFGQTVYGGHFDNKGNLVVTYAQTDINSAITSRTTSYDNPVFYGNIRGLKPHSNNSLCECFNTINGQTGAISFAQNSVNYDFAINSVNAGDTIQVFIRADEYSDVASLKSACGNSKIKYELANPITLSIATQDIPTLLGENNIFSNTGDIDVTIRADIGLYIDKRLNANRSTTNNLVRAAAYVEDPESVNESQEANVEPQNEER